MREIREAIRDAFDGDDEIFKYCDPNFKINTIEGLVANIEDKIKDFIDNCNNTSFVRLLDEGKVIGYFFIIKKPNMLISMGVNKQYRYDYVLKNVFNYIVEVFEKDSFESLMWKRNTRAINWLKKCGMKECEFNNKEVCKLKF